MSKITALIAGALLALALTSSVAAGPRSATTAIAADPLVGTWDTGPIPIRKLRAALVAGGYTNAKVTGLFKQFGMTKAYEFKRSFYRENGLPFLYLKGWDPSRGGEPNDAEHGPYTLLANGRFVSRGVDPPTDRNRQLFSYTVKGKWLTLRLVRLTEPAFSKADLLIDTMLLRASAALPYKRIG